MKCLRLPAFRIFAKRLTSRLYCYRCSTCGVHSAHHRDASRHVHLPGDLRARVINAATIASSLAVQKVCFVQCILFIFRRKVKVAEFPWC